jgi:hypothetical protein
VAIALRHANDSTPRGLLAMIETSQERAALQYLIRLRYALMAKEPLSGNEEMKRGIWIGLGILVLIGVAHWYTQDFDDAQAATDRQTVNCLTTQLTQDEKQRLAQFTAVHDRESIHAVFEGVLPRCVVRGDQWERSTALVTSARQILRYDPEFKRMVAAGSLTAMRP